MSRRDARRGGGAIKGLSAVLAVLVLLTLYLLWQNDLAFGDLPTFFLQIPLWFYLLASLMGAAIVAVAAALRTGRARESVNEGPAGAPASREPLAFDENPANLPSAAPARPPRIVIPFVPVSTSVSEKKPVAPAGPAHVSLAPLAREPVIPSTAAPLRTPPRKALVITTAGASAGHGSAAPPQVPEPEPARAPPPKVEPVVIPELDSGAAASSEPAAATAPSGRPETLLSRLIDWLEDTSPEVLTSREKPRAPRVLKRRR